MTSPRRADPNRSEARRFAAAFKAAAIGVGLLFRDEPNARWHLAVAAGVLAAAAVLRCERWEWCALLLAIGLVWTAEGLNTAIERTVDAFCPTHHKEAGAAKDLAAGAVLLASIAAAAVGLVVFLPKLWLA
ncbi:MAG: diacylglycerol kinase family protein [Planctomycetia bacterium]